MTNFERSEAPNRSGIRPFVNAQEELCESLQFLWIVEQATIWFLDDAKALRCAQVR
jgi:hypothetical protein